jgi:hypothetical protein
MFEPSERARSSENTTSSAVKSAPSWNFTPSRSLNTHTVGSSSFTYHSVARRGVSTPAGSRSIRVS